MNNNLYDLLLNEIDNKFNKDKINILEYNDNINDTYITFLYNDSEFFKHIFSLINKGYAFEFKKIDSKINITISGNDKLIEDLITTLSNKVIEYPDIEEILLLFNKIHSNDNVNMSIYYNGVNYYYSISDNPYDFALEYVGFIFDGYYYRYQASNNNIVYELLKDVNKNLIYYNRLMKDTDNIENNNIYGNNCYITEIKDIYNNGNIKSIYVIIHEKLYNIALLIDNNIYLYTYTTRLSINNILPEVIDMYLYDNNGEYKEEINSCLGKSFYKNIINNNILYIYNIDEEDLGYYIDYIHNKNNEIKKENDYKKDYYKEYINKEEKNGGYINIFVLIVGVTILSILLFISTIIFIKGM